MHYQWPAQFSPSMVRTGLGGGGVSSYGIALEAWRRGLEVAFTSADLQSYSVTDSFRRVDFDFSLPVSITPKATRRALDRKSETNDTLLSNGVRAPRGFLVDATGAAPEDLIGKAGQIGYPVVLKPDMGSTGNGVLTGIANDEELLAGYQHLVSTLKPRRILLEEHIQGYDYRVLVIGQKVAGVVRRIPAHVVGDGVSTIEELISVKNDTRRRNPFLSSGLIRIDFEIEKLLAQQKMTAQSVPNKGDTIALRRIANASAGGDVEDVTNEFPQPIKLAAIRAAHSFPHLIVAGVDVLYNPSTPAVPKNYAIIEINPRPHLGVNMYPTGGTGRAVPRDLVETLFPGSLAPGSDDRFDLRFNEMSVKSALRSGAVSEVKLPRIPSHGFRYRVQTTFPGWSEAYAERRFPQATLQKYALGSGVSGSARLTRGGSIRMQVATSDSTAAEAFVRRAADLIRLDHSTPRRWDGPVTVGFAVSV